MCVCVRVYVYVFASLRVLLSLLCSSKMLRGVRGQSIYCNLLLVAMLAGIPASLLGALAATLSIILVQRAQKQGAGALTRIRVRPGASEGVKSGRQLRLRVSLHVRLTHQHLNASTVPAFHR